LTTRFSGADDKAAAPLTAGTSSAMLRSISVNCALSMKKMMSRNNTSIMDTRFMTGGSST
jgi:hypothetical protein